ncbi:D-tyrosyl-tRNA(Tyr) deacylase [Alicyclobacillaceae bacterium I2511]|nr:D-tyrosyl-tRNA(Tyr) deacylase [Alicyclobacillaceae bacterium I2511]
MRVVVQRVREASVQVAGQTVGSIGNGLLLLVGIAVGDQTVDLNYIVQKIVHLRIFEDAQGKMNRDILELGGSVLSVSQFTLYGDVRHGRRPSFSKAADQKQARQWFDELNSNLRKHDLTVETGVFGAMMDVRLVNDGPVTLILDSERQC